MKEDMFQGIIIKEPDHIHVDLERNKEFRLINTDIKFQKAVNPLMTASMLLDGEVIMIQPFRNNIVTIVKESRSGLNCNTLLTDGSFVEKGRVIFANCEGGGTEGEITGLSAEQVRYLMDLYSVNKDFNTFTDGLYE